MEKLIGRLQLTKELTGAGIQRAERLVVPAAKDLADQAACRHVGGLVRLKPCKAMDRPELIEGGEDVVRDEVLPRQGGAAVTKGASVATGMRKAGGRRWWRRGRTGSKQGAVCATASTYRKPAPTGTGPVMARVIRRLGASSPKWFISIAKTRPRVSKF
jgi:hypothetical protein